MIDALLGTLIKDRYRIDEHLGSGGFGAVYLARDQKLRDRPVVIKILLEKAQADEWFQRKFSQEIEALSRINHPGVVSVIDAGELESGQPFMVQQFVEGATLRDAIKPGGMELPRVANIIRRAGQALSAAHDRGIFHRDLKPENIMLQQVAEGEEHVTLIDFGIASVTDSDAGDLEKTKVTGTFTYMAPEQFDGRPSASSDIYALGVIAYEMLAGVPPSTGRPLFEVMMMQKEGTWPKISELRPSVPIGAQESILKALAYKPQDRQATARELGESIARPLEQQSVATLAERPAAPHRPTVKGRTLVWTLSAVTVLALVFALWMWRNRRIEQAVVLTPPPKPAVVEPQRKLAYSVSVRPQEGGEPFPLPHERVFRTNDRIFLTMTAQQPGFLYILNQEPALRDGLPSYVMLFPSRTANGGSPRLSEGQTLRIPQDKFFRFEGQLGAERLWIVWSDKEIPALSGIHAGPPALSIDVRTQIQEYLKIAEAARPLIEVSDASVQTLLSRPGSLLVHKIELMHL